MQLYPAIDVQGGGLARAAGRDPAAEAHALAGAGATWMHVVDLDRAFGAGRNDAVVRRVLDALAGIRVQLGGGLTAEADVREALGWGAARIVVGPDAIAQLPRLAGAVGPERLGLAIDPRTGAPLPAPPEALTEQAVAAGVTTVVYRDRERDGTLRGADLPAAARLLGRGADVVLAGGVVGLDELRLARARGFAGVIVGRALLEGRFTLAEALACCG